MCFHTNAGQKAKDVELRELRLLHVEKFEMSVVSNCLDCIRMGKGNRYVSPGGVSMSTLTEANELLRLMSGGMLIY